MGVSPKFSLPFNPHQNALAERQVATFKHALHHIIREYKDKWPKFVPYVLWSIRNVPNASTGYSPHEILYGTPGRSFLSVLKERWTDDDSVDMLNVQPTCKYVADLQKCLTLVAKAADENSWNNRQRSLQNKNKRATNKSFEIGDQVILLHKDSTTKLTAEWFAPCIVVQKLDNKGYVIEKPDQAAIAVHVHELRPYINQSQYTGIINSVIIEQCLPDGEIFGEVDTNLIAVIDEADEEQFGVIEPMPIHTGAEQDIDSPRQSGNRVLICPLLSRNN